ncbi:hypothetical protein [Hutsoniella sourekii]|uniref:hypothetical protein n=1 Tax=Hutsoniella sourekii TaxID=87650 RepID=UPI0004885F3C|nr:hypothetical protein [Hutsoniella sourekii]
MKVGIVLKKLVLFPFLLILFLLAGCNKEEFNPESFDDTVAFFEKKLDQKGEEHFIVPDHKNEPDKKVFFYDGDQKIVDLVTTGDYSKLYGCAIFVNNYNQALEVLEYVNFPLVDSFKKKFDPSIEVPKQIHAPYSLYVRHNGVSLNVELSGRSSLLDDFDDIYGEYPMAMTFYFNENQALFEEQEFEKKYEKVFGEKNPNLESTQIFE